MATWLLGPLRIGAGAAKTLGIAGGAAAIAGGLAFGVATAADPGALAQPSPGASPATHVGAKPRMPLHRILAAALRGRRAPATTPAQTQAPVQRTVFGRVLSLGGGTATVQTASGEVITVRANAQTKLPARQVRPGDPVVIIGQREPNGTYIARAVLSRQAPAHQQGQPAVLQRGTGPAH